MCIRDRFISDAYSYRGREFDVVDKVSGFTGLGDALKNTKRAVVLPYGFAGDAAMDASTKLPFPAVAARDYGTTGAPVVYDRGGFDRPAYVMFSSGTTGKPKCIVQGPGVALNHAKEGALHWDLRESDRSLWYTTTGWMMWNWLLGAALTNGAGAVLWDSDATYSGFSRSKSTDALFEVALAGDDEHANARRIRDDAAHFRQRHDAPLPPPTASVRRAAVGARVNGQLPPTQSRRRFARGRYRMRCVPIRRRDFYAVNPEDNPSVLR